MTRKEYRGLMIKLLTETNLLEWWELDKTSNQSYDALGIRTGSEYIYIQWQPLLTSTPESRDVTKNGLLQEGETMVIITDLTKERTENLSIIADYNTLVIILKKFTDFCKKGIFNETEIKQ